MGQKKFSIDYLRTVQGFLHLPQKYLGLVIIKDRMLDYMDNQSGPLWQFLCSYLSYIEHFPSPCMFSLF